MTRKPLTGFMCPRPYRYPIGGTHRWAVQTNRRSRSYRRRWVAYLAAFAFQRGRGGVGWWVWIRDFRRRYPEAERIDR